MTPLKRLCLIAALFLLPDAAWAHFFWINATDYTAKVHPKYGAATNVYFGWGHHYPVDDFLPEDYLARFSLITPKGNEVMLRPNPGGFLATEVTFKTPGLYIIAAIRKPLFYTMYIEKGEVHHRIGPKQGGERVIFSSYGEQYAKSLISVGTPDGDSFAKPVGHKLEIIPLQNPYELRGSGADILAVKVLFNGKPARNCRIYATYSGFSTDDDFAYATSTDEEGIGRIRLTHWGPWLIVAKKELPPTGDLKDKCDIVSYAASLTFEVP